VPREFKIAVGQTLLDLQERQHTRSLTSAFRQDEPERGDSVSREWEGGKKQKLAFRLDITAAVNRSFTERRRIFAAFRHSCSLL